MSSVISSVLFHVVSDVVQPSLLGHPPSLLLHSGTCMFNIFLVMMKTCVMMSLMHQASESVMSDCLVVAVFSCYVMINLHCRQHIIHSRISEYTRVALKTSDLSKSVEFFRVEDRDDMIELRLSGFYDLLLGSLL